MSKTPYEVRTSTKMDRDHVIAVADKKPENRVDDIVWKCKDYDEATSLQGRLAKAMISSILERLG